MSGDGSETSKLVALLDRVRASLPLHAQQDGCSWLLVSASLVCPEVVAVFSSHRIVLRSGLGQRSFLLLLKQYLTHSFGNNAQHVAYRHGTRHTSMRMLDCYMPPLM